MILHAGLIALRLAGAWRGVLIEGPSGSGKSDLALRSISEGFRLVADDRVVTWTSGGRLFGRAPDSLTDLLEARGVGVVAEPTLVMAEVSLVARAGTSDRMPNSAYVEILGLRLPLLSLQLGDISAPMKLKRALCHFDGAFKKRI